MVEEEPSQYATSTIVLDDGVEQGDERRGTACLMCSLDGSVRLVLTSPKGSDQVALPAIVDLCNECYGLATSQRQTELVARMGSHWNAGAGPAAAYLIEHLASPCASG